MSMHYELGLFTDQIGSTLYTIAHGVVVAEVPDLASHLRNYGGPWAAGRETAATLLTSNYPSAAARADRTSARVAVPPRAVNVEALKPWSTVDTR